MILGLFVKPIKPPSPGIPPGSAPELRSTPKRGVGVGGGGPCLGPNVKKLCIVGHVSGGGGGGVGAPDPGSTPRISGI